MKQKTELVRFIANIAVRYPAFPNKKDNIRNNKQLRKEIKDLLETYSYISVEGPFEGPDEDYGAYAPDISCVIRETPCF